MINFITFCIFIKTFFIFIRKSENEGCVRLVEGNLTFNPARPAFKYPC